MTLGIETSIANLPVRHYRRKEKTHEEFIKWMVEEHLPLAMPVFKRHGILSYSLVSTFSSSETCSSTPMVQNDEMPAVSSLRLPHSTTH